MTEIPPAWIAERLSQAQRDALLWLPADGTLAPMAGRAPEVSAAALTDLVLDEEVPAELAAFQWVLVGVDWMAHVRATALGLRVREVVEREAGR